jgi:hypothetical protein
MRARQGAAAAALALAFCALAAGAEGAEGKGAQISGVMETRVGAVLTPEYEEGGGGPNYAAEQYANLRLKAPLGEKGALYAAANLVAAAGGSVPYQLSGTSGMYEPAEGFVVGRGYAAAMELERLYYRVGGEAFDVDVGLQRLAFGFGPAFSPADFLVSRNPLYPDARSRGSLAAAASLYPGPEWKARVFAVAAGGAVDARGLALDTTGEGAIAGLSGEFHGSAASVQALYAIEADSSGVGSATHRFGLSAKLDAGASFILDALYVLDGDWLEKDGWYGRDWKAYRGLEASFGVDYSILDGDLYMLGQYCFHGGGALDPGDGLDLLYSGYASWSDLAPASRIALVDASLPLGELNRRDYLFAELLYRFDDYRNLTLSCIAGLDDASWLPALGFDDELFQGFTLGLSCRVPLDERSFSSGGEYGELGPVHSGTAGELTVKAKLKF